MQTSGASRRENAEPYPQRGEGRQPRGVRRDELSQTIRSRC